jgi:hypothetical protein
MTGNEHGHGDLPQRPETLTVSVQTYDIADVPPAFGKEPVDRAAGRSQPAAVLCAGVLTFEPLRGAGSWYPP